MTMIVDIISNPHNPLEFRLSP